MAVNEPEVEAEPREGQRRLSISERAVRDIVENAVLRLQLELGKAFASAADMSRHEAALKEYQDATTKRFEAVEQKATELEQDKAGRDAVTAYKKWLTGGAIFATVFMAIQVAISIWIVTRGSGQ